MLRIATVDDNPADLKEIRMCLSHYFQKRAGQTPIDYTISAYTSGPSFLENFEKGDYDLILLDIYMPRMTGMQVAEEIRAIDEDAWIIFLTTSRDHALESYNVFASGYVLKPLLENAPQLETLLTRLLPEDALAAKTLAAKTLAAKTLTVKLAGGECLSVPYSHILYMDCQGSRGAILHLEGRTLASQNSYHELADILLTDERFLETYHRLILNMNAVTAMKEDTFLLKGDLSLPISRRKKKEVKQQYMQFLLSR